MTQVELNIPRCRTMKHWLLFTFCQSSRELSRRLSQPTPSLMRSKCAADLKSDKIVIVNLSGRGDKDVNTVQESLKSDSGTS
mgnify:CR=1 FL=1